MLFDLFFIAKIAGFVEPGVFDFIRKILLFYIMIRIVMCIFISDPMSQIFRTLVMCILQM